MDYYQKRTSRHRKILELAMYDEWTYEKRRLRDLYAVLEKDCSIRGYKLQLEKALGFVNKAIAAIDILEGK